MPAHDDHEQRAAVHELADARVSPDVAQGCGGTRFAPEALHPRAAQDQRRRARERDSHDSNRPHARGVRRRVRLRRERQGSRHRAVDRVTGLPTVLARAHGGDGLPLRQVAAAERDARKGPFLR